MTFLPYSVEASLKATELSKQLSQDELRKRLSEAYEHALARGAKAIELEDIEVRRG